MKKVTAILLAVLLIVTCFTGCKGKDTEISVREFSKYGNAILEMDFSQLADLDIAVADIVTVTVGETSYDMPVGTSFSDVDNGKMVMRMDMDDNEVSLAINMGSFAEETGMAAKEKIEEDPGYLWTASIDKVSIVLKEKGGYADQYKIRNLERTDERGDYAELTDEEFANFRAVTTTGIREGVLYRGGTPVEEAMGRNEYSMAAVEKHGIRTIINLDDAVEDMEEYESYPDSYYSRCSILNPDMGYDFTSDDFKADIKACIQFMNENEAPYYIHCKEGKDRTGILCALLECYMGASFEEVRDDYMASFANYYKVEAGSDTYDMIVNSNLVTNLRNVFELETLDGADLQQEAADYLLSVGLSESDLQALSLALGA